MKNEREKKLEKMIKDLAATQSASNDRLDKKLDSLGEMMTEGFYGLNNRIDGVEARLGNMEKEVVGLKTNVATLFDWIKKIDKKLEEVSLKIDKLIGQVGRNEEEQKVLVLEVKRLDKELTRIKKVLKIA